MTRAVVVHYRTRADCANCNQALVERMCDELRAIDPGGLRMQVFRLEDGVGFVHVVVFDGTSDPFEKSAAFEAFHEGIKDRLVGSAQAMRGVLIGSYP